MNVLIRQGFLSARGNASKQLYACYSTSICDKEKIESLVKGKKVVVFMKGNPAVPQCGFSKAVVQIFDFHGVNNYDTHNVLDDECIREGVKAYSNWPTIPQVFMGGQFIGGCDILLELHQNGDLINELNKVGIRSTLIDEPDKKA